MPEKILIIDDDIDTLKLVGLMLQKQGYTILAASNGLQGLEQAEKELPDLIILDVMMPDMDGFEVARSIRANKYTSDIPILMFTAKTMVDDKVTGFEAGADDYITKPTHPSELLAHVKALISRTRSKETSDSQKYVLESAFREQTNGIVEVADQIKILNDQVNGPDRLNYSRFARAFASLVCNPDMVTPITVGIFGQWGKGKSFLMQKIKEAINEIVRKERKGRVKRNRLDILTIEFNAWSYSGSQHLWAGFVTHMYNEVEKYMRGKVILHRLAKAAKKTWRKAAGIIGYYSILGLCLGILLDFNRALGNVGGFKIVLNAFVGSVLGGSALASLPVLWSTLRDISDTLFLSRAKKLQQLVSRPDFHDQIGIMADIKSEIKFISSILKKDSTRVVLFIDDLDRCEHKKAVEVLQAIMLLLADEDGSPFVTFLGIDARVIVRAIEENYGDVLVKAGINGYEYLDKIIQIPFVIPPPNQTEISNYVDSLLWSSDEEKKKVAEKLNLPAEKTSKKSYQTESNLLVAIPPFSTLAQQIENKIENKVGDNLEELAVAFTRSERKALMDCVDEFVDNPRKIKRIINIYRLQRLLLPVNSIDRKKMIRWILLTEQWPLHAAWILETIGNDYQMQKKLYKKANATILDVYKNVKKSIYSNEMRSILGIDAPPSLFDEFIHRQPIFTVKEIYDTFSPMTFNLNPAIQSEVRRYALNLPESLPMYETTLTKSTPSARLGSDK